MIDNTPSAADLDLDASNPDRNLIAAILFCAISDLNREDYKIDAMNWFRGVTRKAENCFSFEECCEFLDLNPQHVLSALEVHITGVYLDNVKKAIL